MSDGPQGAGWWQASDGRWYPPESAPGAAPPPPPAYPPQPGGPPPFTPYSSPTPATRPFGANQWTVLAAAVVAAIGSCLTWATVDAGFVSVSKNGLDGDGVITLVLAVGVGILAGLRKVPILGLLVALGILGIAVYDVIDILTTDSVLGISPDVGIGLWVVAAAGIVAVVGAARELQAANAARG